VVQSLGGPMATPEQAGNSARNQEFDVTAAPRAVLRESVRLLYRVLGEERLGTARGNAWEAVCANRESARSREELARLRERW
jgi:hypothetical protein